MRMHDSYAPFAAPVPQVDDLAEGRESFDLELGNAGKLAGEGGDFLAAPPEGGQPGGEAVVATGSSEGEDGVPSAAPRHRDSEVEDSGGSWWQIDAHCGMHSALVCAPREAQDPFQPSSRWSRWSSS